MQNLAEPVVVYGHDEAHSGFNNVSVYNSFVFVSAVEAKHVPAVPADLVIGGDITSYIVATLIAVLWSFQLEVATHRNFQTIVQQAFTQANIQICPVSSFTGCIIIRRS